MIKNKIKVDFVLTDPPYNISKSNRFHTMKGRQGIDFGSWDKDFDQTTWIKKLNKIVNKDGGVIIFNSWKNLGLISETLENSGFETKDIITWKKTNPMPRNRERRYIVDREFAIWAVKKNSNWTFNKPKNKAYIIPEYTSSLVCGNEKTKHPTQKKVSVIKEIIETHTNKNDIVLDLFMGSGTTGIAALSSLRRFIGVELNREYFNIVKTRFLG